MCIVCACCWLWDYTSWVGSLRQAGLMHQRGFQDRIESNRSFKGGDVLKGRGRKEGGGGEGEERSVNGGEVNGGEINGRETSHQTFTHSDPPKKEAPTLCPQKESKGPTQPRTTFFDHPAKKIRLKRFCLRGFVGRRRQASSRSCVWNVPAHRHRGRHRVMSGDGGMHVPSRPSADISNNTETRS